MDDIAAYALLQKPLFLFSLSEFDVETGLKKQKTAITFV